MTGNALFGNLMMASLGLAFISMFVPLWRSSTLSPDAIKRRTYWAASATAVACTFLFKWPEWRIGLFGAVLIGSLLVVFAGRFTRHIKIRGRVYGMPGTNVPDRPPSRAPKEGGGSADGR